MKKLSSSAALLALVVSLPAQAQTEAEAAAISSDSSAGASEGGTLVAEEPAAAEEQEDSTTGRTLADRIRAVSRPVFRKQGRFELTPLAGVSASDAFFRRWTVGARGSYHLLESVAIDVGGAYNAWSEPLDAAVFLGAFNQAPTVQDPAALYGYVDGGITFEPFYGKVALMSEWTIHFDSYVSGGAAGVMENVLVDAAADTKAFSFAPGLEVGAGARVFLTPWLCLRADVRDYFYYPFLARAGSGLSLQNLLLVNLGVGFYIPFGFDDDEDVVKEPS